MITAHNIRELSAETGNSFDFCRDALVYSLGDMNNAKEILTKINDSASVKQVRERTGASYMISRRALLDALGDIELAAEMLVRQGYA